MAIYSIQYYFHEIAFLILFVFIRVIKKAELLGAILRNVHEGANLASLSISLRRKFVTSAIVAEVVLYLNYIARLKFNSKINF